MYLEVQPASSGLDIALREPSNFTELAVRVPAQVQPTELAGLLTETGWGHLTESSGLALQVPRLRNEVHADTDADVSRKFDAMLDFARSRGWLSADGSTVDAHIEWT